MNKNILGIDLGTTNSVACSIDESGNARPIKNAEGSYITPSAICFTPNNEIVVGEEAKNLQAAFPEDYVHEIKRQMGKCDDSGKPITFHIDKEGKEWNAEELSALILKKIKHDAETITGNSFDEVLITVPACFDQAQRQATINAGKIAGFSKIEIMDEPTVASVASGISKHNGMYVLYDLGGGTFDVSVLEIDGHGATKIIATAGQANLGGTDFDLRIIQRINKEAQTQGVDLVSIDDPSIAYEIKDKAQRLKHTLSVREETDFNMFIQGKQIKFTYSRKELETETQDLIESTIEKIQSALGDKNLSPIDIGETILAGGATRMPRIAERLEEFMGRPPVRNEDPDLLIAMGAAVIFAAMTQADGETVLSLSGTEVKSLPSGTFVNCAAHCLGCKAIDSPGLREIFSVIIPQNTPLPAKCSDTFKLLEKHQTQVEVYVYQGKEDGALSECLLIDKVLLTGLPVADVEEARISVEYKYSRSGIVDVTVQDLISGKSKVAQISHQLGMNETQVQESAEQVSQRNVA